MSGRVLAGGRRPAKTMGVVEERTWTTIAADTDGVVDEHLIGTRKVTRDVYFAWRHEADEWLAAQEQEGFTATGCRPAATWYFGDTDSPSNCWAASAEREL